MKSQLSKILTYLIFIGIGVALLWFITTSLSEEEIVQLKTSLKNANYFFVIASILFGLASHYIRALRWKMMIKPLGYQPSSINCFFALMIGYITNLAVFRAGEVARCGFLTKYENVPAEKLFGTVVTERIIDVIILLSLIFISVFTQFDLLYNYFDENILSKIKGILDNSTFLAIAFFALVGLSVLGFFILKKMKFWDKIKNILIGFKDGILSTKSVENLPLFILYSLLIWLGYFLMSWIVFYALPETSHLGIVAGLVLVTFGSLAYTAVQGGIGTYHIAVQQIMVLFGVAASAGLAFAWILWSAQTLLILIFGGLSLVLMPIFNREKETT